MGSFLRRAQNSELKISVSGVSDADGCVRVILKVDDSSSVVGGVVGNSISSS